MSSDKDTHILLRQPSPLFFAVLLSVMLHLCALGLYFQAAQNAHRQPVVRQVITVALVAGVAQQKEPPAPAVRPNPVLAAKPQPVVPAQEKAKSQPAVPAKERTRRQPAVPAPEKAKSQPAVPTKERIKSQPVVVPTPRSDLRRATESVITPGAIKPSAASQHKAPARSATSVEPSASAFPEGTAGAETVQADAAALSPAAGPSAYSPAPPPGQSGVRAEHLRQLYQQQLRARIVRYKSYPLMARKSGQQGTVHIHFVLDLNGALLSCEVERAAGSRLLDRAALRAIEAAAPFPAPPVELVEGTDLSFAIPVTFLLER